MLQAHYIAEGFNVFLVKVVADLEKKGLVREKEDIFRFKHTYYDSGSKTLLKNGGYCRKNIRFDLDLTVPPKVVIEYRPHKKSHTRRYVSEQEMPVEELSKVLGFNYHMKKPVKFQGGQLTLSFRMKEGANGYVSHLDCVIQIGEIVNRRTGRAKRVSLISLIDTTASEYNVGIANYLSYKTEKIISYFEKLMNENGYEKLTSNRYGELLKRMPAEGEIESEETLPVFSGEKRENSLEIARRVFGEYCKTESLKEENMQQFE